MGAMVVVEVPPFGELVVKQLGAVDNSVFEHPVEPLPRRRRTLASGRRVQGLGKVV